VLNANLFPAEYFLAGGPVPWLSDSFPFLLTFPFAAVSFSGLLLFAYAMSGEFGILPSHARVPVCVLIFFRRLASAVFLSFFFFSFLPQVSSLQYPFFLIVRQVRKGQASFGRVPIRCLLSTSGKHFSRGACPLLPSFPHVSPPPSLGYRGFILIR